jgi:hypothetical protein
VKAVFLVGIIRLGFWLLPFRAIWNMLKAVNQKSLELPRADPVLTDRAAWAIRTTIRHLLEANCLTQAFATQVLLLRHGYKVCLRIGVSRDGSGRLGAHAWIESQGRIVIGGLEDLTGYSLFHLPEKQSQ